MGFYALVCGLLSGFVPQGIGRILRFGLGAVVGIVAAGALPALRSSLGLY